ncbi:alpha-2,8-polysialyltransferase family protein [Cytobacillus firmus]|uniref:alpha-2,8-polysialyltransferase family protein n=1 Tax=Cytobacillus firmus TaxID=1399 RepID=UPI002162A0D9|nr:alpha-2,8-polysialyltransferase family protein [Cytobacillus firmus]MCS0654759.1 alpha-2,8-polysialyltransferase family protein [Cytobacillus firmus]MCU1807080.1 alpha-2,8-polysialyltransferase family protein [Cytobacillus firmus]
MNLFVISNIGQLYQAQALIRKEHLDDNVMVILYTKLNTTILDYLVGSVDSSLFTNVEPLLLPNNPNKFTRRKLVRIRNQYEQLFNSYNFEKVFICSFESHYNFIKDISLERNIELMLFEEGTATYKFLIDHDVEEPNFAQRFKQALRISKNDFKKAYKNSFLHDIIRKSFIIQSIKALFKTAKRVAASLFTMKQRNRLKSSFYPNKIRSVFSTIEEFDELYVAFPNKAKEIFKAKRYNELVSDYSLNEETTNLIEESEALKNLTTESIVFVNQKYNVPIDLHVKVILSFLAERYANEQIFIKFHPKDTKLMKETFAKGISRYNLNAEIIDLDIEVPFEAILKVKKPKMVIGISSTSLIYTEKIIPSTITLSCANYYIQNLVSKKIDKKVIDTLTFHKKILETLSDIEVK